jgi:hypothetical protein
MKQASPGNADAVTQPGETHRGDRRTAVPSVGAGFTGTRRPSALERQLCGHGLGMMLRKSSKKFEELPPGLV